MNDSSASGTKRARRGCLLGVLALVLAVSIVCCGMARSGDPSGQGAGMATRVAPPASSGSTARSSGAASPSEIEAGAEEARAAFEAHFRTTLAAFTQRCWRTEHAVSCASGVCVARWREPVDLYEQLVPRLRYNVSEQIAHWLGTPDEELPCRALDALPDHERHYMVLRSGVSREHCVILADPSGPPLDRAMTDDALARCRALEL